MYQLDTHVSLSEGEPCQITGTSDSLSRVLKDPYIKSQKPRCAIQDGSAGIRCYRYMYGCSVGYLAIIVGVIISHVLPRKADTQYGPTVLSTTLQSYPIPQRQLYLLARFV